MFDWRVAKNQMRQVLNECINAGKTADETAVILTQFKHGQCSSCCASALACGYGRTYCDAHVCFLDTALATYIKVAEEKCIGHEKSEEEK